MPQALGAGLDAVIDRIAVPDARDDERSSSETGELERLRIWWRSVSDGSAPSTATLRCLVGSGDKSAQIPATSDEASGVEDAIREGIAAADREIDAGRTLLVPRVANRQQVAALTVIAILTRSDPAAITYQLAGMSDRAWIQRCGAVRDAAVEHAELRSAPIALLAALGATEIAYAVGAVLAAAARRTPSIIDGTDELAAALVADRLCFRAKEWWRAGSTSPDPGRQAVVDRLDLAAGLPLDLTDDDGRGADATIALIALLATDS